MLEAGLVPTTEAETVEALAEVLAAGLVPTTEAETVEALAEVLAAALGVWVILLEEMMGEKLASVMALMSELKTGRQHRGTCSGMQGSIFF